MNGAALAEGVWNRPGGRAPCRAVLRGERGISAVVSTHLARRVKPEATKRSSSIINATPALSVGTLLVAVRKDAVAAWCARELKKGGANRLVLAVYGEMGKVPRFSIRAACHCVPDRLWPYAAAHGCALW